MLKQILIILNLAGIMTFSIFGEKPKVRLSLEFPDEVNAGDVFEVKLTVYKNAFESFARLDQELPPGFEFVEGTGERCDFLFEDGMLKIVWPKLPFKEYFVVTYKIRVSPYVSGTYKLGGTFRFVSENKAVPMPLDEYPIKVNNTGFAKGAGVEAFSSRQDLLDSPLSVLRKVEENGEGGKIVTLLVNNKKLEQFAKIEEVLPEGYSAYPIDKKEAIFSADEGAVKFLWMDLPEEEQFTVAYKLVPTGEAPQGDIALAGDFSFVLEDQTQSISIIPYDQATPDDLMASNDMFAEAETKEPIEETPIEKEPKEKEPVVEEQPDETEEPEIAEVTEEPGTVETEPELNIPDPNADGVTYHVQVGAYKKYLDEEFFNRKLNIEGKVEHDKHDGLNKYIVGRYTRYRNARDHRMGVWRNTPVTDAFVAAYNNGERITVQEALMITNQDWVK
jgi:cell division septation protein DedD